MRQTSIPPPREIDQRHIVITTHVPELNAALIRLRLPVPFLSSRIYDSTAEEMP